MHRVPAIVGGGSLLAGASFAWDARAQAADTNRGARVYTAGQVAEHDGLGGRPAYLTVGRGVYNVTSFARGAHPGGAIILAAAGGPAEPFLAQWAAHWRSEDQAATAASGQGSHPRPDPDPGPSPDAFRLKPEVLRMLERMRVGTLAVDAGADADADRAGAEQGEGAHEDAHAHAAEPLGADIGMGISVGLDEGASASEALAQTAREFWQHEPARASGLLVTTVRPFQGEPRTMPPRFLTPNHLFYVRNHGAVPVIDRDTYGLRVEPLTPPAPLAPGESAPEPRRAPPLLTLAALEDEARFPRRRVACTLQCTGNRCDELHKGAEGRGSTPFDGRFAGSKGYIGNAYWEGPLLRDVLLGCGVLTQEELDQELAQAQEQGQHRLHLEMEGADGFCLSVPLAYALHPTRPTLLATRMNGAALPRDHGAPVRVLVAGAVGARCVKWVVRLSVLREESRSPWQRLRYRTEPSQGGRTEPILHWPIQAIITSHNDGGDAVLLPGTASDTCDGGAEHGGADRGGSAGSLRVHGVAYAGGGQDTSQVEVSADGGNTWHRAELEPRPVAAGGSSAAGERRRRRQQQQQPQWSWVLWHADLALPPAGEGAAAAGGGERRAVELRCRATSTSGHVQPRSVADCWTPSGYLLNAEHSVRVRLRDKGTAPALQK